MERCTLCGGKLVNGRCTECGLDNTKNDKKYHLNTHNEKSAAMFHRGDCEDHLNKDNGYGDNWPWKRKKQPATAGLEHYQRRGATAGTTTAAGSFAGTSAGADKAAAWASTASATAQTSSAADRVPQGTARSTTSGAVPAGKSAAARRRELKRRSQTGTVRKKSGAGRLIKLLFLIIILLFVVFPIVAQKLIEYKRNGGTIFNFNIGGSGNSDNGPEPIAWDEDDERYYGIALEPGIYEVGYEIPAGEYQLCCAKESAFVYWREADAEAYASTELTLYAPERQESYKDFWDEDCPYYEYSDIIALEEGTEVVIETGLDIGGVELRGLTKPGAVRKDREPQQGLEEVQLEESMVAGRDFPAGTYNLILDNADEEYSYNAVSLSVKGEGKNYTAEVSSEQPVYWRIPFEDGDELKILYKSDEAGAHLIPSF